MADIAILFANYLFLDAYTLLFELYTNFDDVTYSYDINYVWHLTGLKEIAFHRAVSCSAHQMAHYLGLDGFPQKTPLTPAATAARANIGTNSRWPPDVPPSPPGCCTECVASNITGYPNVAHLRQRTHIRYQCIISKACTTFCY